MVIKKKVQLGAAVISYEVTVANNTIESPAYMYVEDRYWEGGERLAKFAKKLEDIPFYGVLIGSL